MPLGSLARALPMPQLFLFSPRRAETRSVAPSLRPRPGRWLAAGAVCHGTARRGPAPGANPRPGSVRRIAAGSCRGSGDVGTAQLGKYEDPVAGSSGVVCPSTSSAGQQELGGHPLQVHLPPLQEHQWAHLQQECVPERLNRTQDSNNCLHVVEPMPVPGNDVEAYCLLCECKYEERSTTTIKIIIIIYLSVVGALLLYMAFLMLVDPLIRKPDAYAQPLRNEEDSEEARSLGAATPPAGARANTVLERVEGAQQRWKRQVQEQRKTVFDRHKMLS